MHLGSVSGKCSKCPRLCVTGGRCKGLSEYDRVHCPIFISRMTSVLYSGGVVQMILTTKREKTLFRMQARHQN